MKLEFTATILTILNANKHTSKVNFIWKRKLYICCIMTKKSLYSSNAPHQLLSIQVYFNSFPFKLEIYNC